MQKDMGAICSQGHLSHLRSELLWSRLGKKSILYLSVLVFQTLHQIAKALRILSRHSTHILYQIFFTASKSKYLYTSANLPLLSYG